MKSKLQKIHLYATHALVIAAVWILEASVRVHANSHGSTTTSPLPAPPKLGTTGVSGDNPLAYMTGAIKYLVTAVCVILAAVAIVIFAGGIISELSEARQRGQWGKFGTFVAAGIMVILLVMAGGWWAGTYLASHLT